MQPLIGIVDVITDQKETKSKATIGTMEKAPVRERLAG